MGVAFGWFRLTRRDRHPSAVQQCGHLVVALGSLCRRDGLVGEAAGDGKIPVCERGLDTPDVQRGPRNTQDHTLGLPGRLTHLVRRCKIPGGQRRHSQRYAPGYPEHPAKLRVARKARLGRRSGRIHLSLLGEGDAPTARQDLLQISS